MAKSHHFRVFARPTRCRLTLLRLQLQLQPKQTFAVKMFWLVVGHIGNYISVDFQNDVIAFSANRVIVPAIEIDF